MTKREKEKEVKANVGRRKGWAWLFFILIVAQVVLANSLVARGREINELVAERKHLQAEIVSFENEIARASSLAAVRQGAELLGMGPGTIEFLPPPPLASAGGSMQ